MVVGEKLTATVYWAQHGVAARGRAAAALQLNNFRYEAIRPKD
jgi:hypothetical protein